jgi:hypothetical protein
VKWTRKLSAKFCDRNFKTLQTLELEDFEVNWLKPLLLKLDQKIFWQKVPENLVKV